MESGVESKDLGGVHKKGVKKKVGCEEVRKERRDERGLREARFGLFWVVNCLYSHKPKVQFVTLARCPMSLA